MTQQQLADAVGKTRGAVAQWEAGEVQPRRKTLEAIAEATGTSITWLERGVSPATTEKPTGKPKGSNSNLIDEIDLVGGLGGGGLAALEVHTHNGITFSKEVVRDQWRLPDWIMNRMNVRAAHVAAFPVQGDSMEPTISDGDVVFIDTRHRVPSPPGVYALADEFGGVVVKRLEVTSRPGDEEVTVRISSDNPRHKDRELTLAEIHIIGRYIGRFTI